MSYMRGDPYIYHDVSGDLQIYSNGGSAHIPFEKAEDLAVMIVSELLVEGNLAAVLRRVSDEYDGNIGAMAVHKLLDEPDAMASVLEEAKRLGGILVMTPDEAIESLGIDL